MRLHLARADARFDPHGKLVLLAQQDRSRWDRAATDWPQILALYDLLSGLTPCRPEHSVRR